MSGFPSLSKSAIFILMVPTASAAPPDTTEPPPETGDRTISGAPKLVWVVGKAPAASETPRNSLGSAGPAKRLQPVARRSMSHVVSRSVVKEVVPSMVKSTFI